MTPDQNYLDHLRDLINAKYKPLKIEELPQGLTFYSSEQIINKFQSFIPKEVLTSESIYTTLTQMGYELVEIKPFSYVWAMQTK